eukprot:35133-Eustigmatos_ZCMA.PRE.1
MRQGHCNVARTLIGLPSCGRGTHGIERLWCRMIERRDGTGMRGTAGAKGSIMKMRSWCRL